MSILRAEKNTRKRINIKNDNKQYFISLDANWLYGGIKDPDEDYFMFFGTGSPAYFGGIGEDGGINISAYSGTLSEIPAPFEAIQVRDQGLNTYIERLKSNGSHSGTRSGTIRLEPLQR